MFDRLDEKYLNDNVYVYNALAAVNYNCSNNRVQSQNWHRDPGGKKIICNCGYGEGYSVNEVLNAVRDVSGISFPIEIAARRAGDPATLVASNKHISSTLDWRAQFNDLHMIIEHALAWEEKLKSKGDIFKMAS